MTSAQAQAQAQAQDPYQAGNTSFSAQNPGNQIAVDSTSLGEAKVCGRKYFYSIIEGWQPREQSVHLTFGLLMHGARERYDHARSAGQAHDDALDSVLDWALKVTWNRELNRPWISDHKIKNRMTLIRTLVWYLDQFGASDAMQTLQLANGKPAVELSFSFDSGYSTRQGEPIIFCGHMDRIATLNDTPYIIDLKTTLRTLSQSWFAGFTPYNQFSMYLLAGRVAFHVPVKSLIVDGIQVAQGFSRFERGIVPRDDSTIDEWHHDAGYWLGQMQDWATAQDWPMNDKACDMYGGCPFRPVCSRPPVARQAKLQADYKKRIWDPLQRRGDI